MNYIKQLQLENAQLQKEKDLILEGLQDIERYLSLDKFSQDVYVNKQDIFNRIEDIKNNLFHAEVLNS